MLDYWIICVGILMACSGIPQIIKIVKNKHSRDVSIISWGTISFGVSQWLVYGICNNQKPVIITNIACLVVDLIIVFLCWKYRDK